MAKRMLVPPLPNADTAPKRALFREFKAFVHRWLRENLKPLAPEELLSFEEWLDLTNYTDRRKSDLKKLYDEDVRTFAEAIKDHKVLRVKSFIKDENYAEWKFPRWINSRSDVFKIMFGRYVKSIEKKIYALKFFIKNVPVPDRPQFIMDNLFAPSSYYVFTDFTSFESHFVRKLKKACEMQLFGYMLHKIAPDAVQCIKTALCESTYQLGDGQVVCNVQALRMSGEMDTSLSNGFTNLMVMKFTCFKSGCKDAPIVVEGDDALCRTPFPLTARIPTDLGFRIKMGSTQHLNEASFCGQIFDIIDMAVVTDPRDTIVNFGWTKKTDVESSQKRRDLLLRAKGYSLLYSYPGCPILSSMAQYVLRVTKRSETGIVTYVTQDRNLDWWSRETLLQAIKYKGGSVKIGAHTRELVEKLYKITVAEQVELESYFDSLTRPTPITHPIILSWGDTNPQWQEFFELYQDLDRTRVDPKKALALIQHA